MTFKTGSIRRSREERDSQTPTPACVHLLKTGLVTPYAVGKTDLAHSLHASQRKARRQMEFMANPTDHQLAEVERGLNEYNAGVASVRSVTPVRAVFVESGCVVAGIVAAAYWGKLHVRLLWVHPDHQSIGLGSRLMHWAEERGRELRCVSIMVDTMSFQAPEFYAKLGYGQFGVSGGYDGGASRHYFEKML